LGGVSWKDGLLALMLNLSALILALAAGLLASTLVKDRVRALALALIISFVFAGVFMLVHWIGFWWLIAQTRSVVRFAPSFPAFGQMGKLAVRPGSGHTGCRDFLPEHKPGNPGIYSLRRPIRFLEPNVGQLSSGSALRVASIYCRADWSRRPGYLGIMHLAARQVRRTWRLQPLSARQQWLLDIFCTPRIWNRLFRTRRARKLDQNPIGWLQQYSWGNRLNKWGWCLLIVIAECVLVGDSQLTLLWVGQYALAQLLILSLAFTASGSFREEQETGALELLAGNAAQRTANHRRTRPGHLEPVSSGSARACAVMAVLVPGPEIVRRLPLRPGRHLAGVGISPFLCKLLSDAAIYRLVLFAAPDEFYRRMAFDLPDGFVRTLFDLRRPLPDSRYLTVGLRHAGRSTCRGHGCLVSAQPTTGESCVRRPQERFTKLIYALRCGQPYGFISALGTESKSGPD
jgi:hypothetical protein